MHREPRRRSRTVAVFLVLLTTPLMMGGCPEFQNEVVTAFETAVRGLTDAVVTVYFDQYRTN